MSEENSNSDLEEGPSDAKSQKIEVQEDSKASPRLEPELGAVQIEPGADALTVASGATDPVENIITGGVFHGAHFGPVSHRSQLTNIDNQHVAYHHHYYGFESKGRGGSEELILPGGIKVFKSKIIYRADNGFIIYEGEKAKVDGVRKVAVKFLPHSTEALREAESLERVCYHPNVVGIYDTGIHTTEIGENIFIAMERCSLENLFTYVSQNKNFDRQQAMNHSTQIISGLEYIHRRGIAHQDLKPQNILFVDDGGHNQIKITDFGVSKNFLTYPHSPTNQTFGSLGYTSPEIIKGDACSDPTKCDIFSLGIILVFILSNGKHPYGDDNWLWTINIAMGKKPDLSKILFPNGGLRDAICCIILSMLQPNPANRPSAADVLKKWNKDVVEHCERTKMTAVTEDFSEIPVSAQATFSRYETDHDCASSSQPSEKLTSKVNALEQHLTEFEANTSKSLKEIKQQLLHGASGKEQREHEALSLGSRKIPDGSVKLEGSINFCKEPKLHETKPIYKGEKITAGEPIPVVVKLVNYSKNALREAKSLHCIDSHPNVVRIYDSNIYKAELSDYVFIAMEPCSVENLYDYITQLERFNPKQAIKHSTQIISGIKYIHEKGVAHRDIKAHNVLFDADSDYEQIKIVDFGLSKKYLDDPNMTAQPGGTRITSAPEIIKGIKERDEAKCDIFSLGILLFFVLSKGKHPYGQLQENWSSNIANDKNLDLSGIELPSGKKRDAILCILKKMLQHNSVKRPTAKKLLKEWNRRVLDLADPTLEIDDELEENISAPLSKVEYVEAKAKPIDIMGCKLQFEENSFQQMAIVYVGIRPRSDHVPDDKFAISPELECRIFHSNCEREVNISLPIYALPDSNGLTVSGRYQVHGSSDWKNIEDPPMTQKDREVEFKLPPFASARFQITCSKVEVVYTGHLLYFNSEQLYSVVCLDNEALITRVKDIFQRKKLRLASGLRSEPILIKDREQLKYKCTSPVASLEEIVLKKDELLHVLVNCESISIPMPQDAQQEVLKIQMLMSSPQEEILELRCETYDDSTPAVYSVPYINVRRSSERFFDENCLKSSNYLVSHPKGIALIINNEMIETSFGARLGSPVDMKNQVALWKDLGFYVVPKMNLSAEAMGKACKDFADLVRKHKPSIIVVVIMTYGETKDGRQILKGEDGHDIPLQDVISFFTEEKLGKKIPKLFILEACRIEKEIIKEPRFGTWDPDEPDTLVAYSSQIGQFSFRDNNYGSLAMNAVTRVFMQHSYNMAVSVMFTEVNQELSKIKIEMETEEPKRQVPEMETEKLACQHSEMGIKVPKRQTSVLKSVLQKHLFLYPGRPSEV